MNNLRSNLFLLRVAGWYTHFSHRIGSLCRILGYLFIKWSLLLWTFKLGVLSFDLFFNRSFNLITRLLFDLSCRIVSMPFHTNSFCRSVPIITRAWSRRRIKHEPVRVLTLSHFLVFCYWISWSFRSLNLNMLVLENFSSFWLQIWRLTNRHRFQILENVQEWM